MTADPIVLSCGCVHEPRGGDPAGDYDVLVQGACREICDRFAAHTDNQEYREAFSANHDKHRKEIDEYRRGKIS